MAAGKQLKLPDNNLVLSAEDKLFFRKYGSVVAKLRRKPTLVARLVHGIICPPHERQIWRGIWQENAENHIVGSRGTAKSAAVGSMGMSIRAETYARRKYLALSASKFRGGKILMEEAYDFIAGRYKSQRMPAPFGRAMMEHKAGVKKEGDRWFLRYTTHSTLATIPTGNHESARGFRANWLVLDEADNWQRAVLDKYFGPFLAVGTDFENTASGSEGNAIYFTGTVSYAHTDWCQMIEDREKMILRRYEAQKKLQEGDLKGYMAMMNEDDGRLWNLSVMFQRWDYTDLIIPTVLTDPKTEEDIFEVLWPDVNRTTGQVEINPDRLIKYDRRDAQSYVYTYPFAKAKIEESLDDGLTDLDVWAAENRCMPIRTSGGTYPIPLVSRATETELLDDDEAKKRGWRVEDWGSYVPPLLYTCNAPCVLGVDPARTDDFTAFVVIRIGEMADQDKPYDPFTGEGYTPWNNVIWAEAKRHMTIRQIADKIRELKGRYNLITSFNPELAFGIGIDARGAASGTTVRDELARPTPNVDDFGIPEPGWVQPQIIYDPMDEEYRHLAAKTGTWPGLRIIWSSDALNTEWVSFSKGQMEQGRLYIAKYQSQSERYNQEDKFLPGYAGIQSLKNQLLKLQSIPTKYHLKFEIPGNEKKLENKDDLFKAFLYAVSGLKAHLATQTRKAHTPPVTAVRVVKQKESSIGKLHGGSGWSKIKF